MAANLWRHEMDAPDWEMLTLFTATALPRLLRHWHPSLTWQDAEDAAADALLRLWATRDRFDPTRTTGKRWLAQTARRLLIDANRRRLARPELVELDDTLEKPDTEAGPEAVVLAMEATAIWQTILASLPPTQATVLWLCDGLGISQRDVARTLGLSRPALQTRVKLGRHKALCAWTDLEAA